MTLRFWVTAWCVTWVVSAQAGRPFTTEDAGVLDRGACELEAYGDRLAFGAVSKQRGVWVQVNCGVGGGTQLGVGGGRARGDTVLVGAAVGGKTSLYSRQDDGPKVALAYSVAGNRATGARWKQDGALISLVATVPSGVNDHWHANIAWVQNTAERQSSTAWALAWERSLSDAFDVGVETFGSDRAAHWLGLGARWRATERLSFDTSYAVQRGGPRSRQVTLGLKLDW